MKSPKPAHSARHFVAPLLVAVGALCVPLLARAIKPRSVGRKTQVMPAKTAPSPQGDLEASALRDLANAPLERLEDLPLVPSTPRRILNAAELTPDLIRKAEEVLWTQFPPIGTEIVLEVAGRQYVARVEWHFHEFGGMRQPWGYHRGMTLYAAE